MTSDRLSLLSAALRHVRDAEALLPGSPDQAWHLAGYGPECARKACLRDPMFDKVLGHDWTPASEAILDVAASLDPKAVRYALAGWSTAEPTLGQWRPAHRYERTGARAGVAGALVAACARLVRRVHADLWLDGRLVEGGC